MSLELALLVFSQALTIALASGGGGAERHQTYTSGVSDTPDLDTVFADWPYNVLADTCTTDLSDYCVKVTGPRLGEGGYHATITSTLWLCVRRAKPNPEAEPINRVYSYCRWCPNNVGKTGYHGVYSGNSYAVIHHDAVNDRWGMYVNHKPVRVIDDADAMMDAGDFLWVGGVVSNSRSVLGPFVHKTVKVRRTSTGEEVFTPSDTTGILGHEPPEDRYFSQYSADGSVGVFTVGDADCPE